MPTLLDLPEDVLFVLFTQYLPIQDVLLLQQTCRVLHAFGRCDYLWHRLALSASNQLLLDTSHKLLSSLPYWELQQSVIRAIRVEANWSKTRSQIHNLTRVFHGGIVYAMALLQSTERLVTLSRLESGATFLTLWDLALARGSHALASVEVPAATKLAGTVKPDGSILVAVLSSSRTEESLSVFSFFIGGSSEVDTLFPPAPKRVYHMSQHNSKGILDSVQICGDMVSITAAVFTTAFIPPTFQVLLINIGTNQVLHIDPPTDAETEHITCKIFPSHALLITTLKDGLVLLRLFLLPPLLTQSTSCGFAALSQELADYVAECRYSLGNGYAFHFSDGLFLPTQSLTRLSMLAYPVFNPFSSGVASFHSFHVDLASTPPTITVLPGMKKHHQVLPGASIDIVCMGSSGARAVLLENLAETDEMRLIKSQCQGGTASPVFGELIPAHVALPFAMQACKSVAFDEALGRICLGLHTGELYILDF